VEYTIFYYVANQLAIFNFNVILDYKYLRTKQEAQLSVTNCTMPVCKVVEVCMQDFLSEYVDKKFMYICYRGLIRHE